MKTKKLILLALCACGCLTLKAQNKEKAVSYDQVFHEKINFIRISDRANATFVIDTNYKEESEFKSLLDGTTILKTDINSSKISVVYPPGVIKDHLKAEGFCTVILDTLVIPSPKYEVKGNIIITLSNQPRKIILDSLASASITYVQDAKYISLLAGKRSQCLFVSKVSTDSLYCDTKERADVVFDSLFISKYRKISVSNGARFLAKEGFTNPKATFTYLFDDIGTGDINFYGNSCYSAKDFSKAFKHNPYNLRGIKRFGNVYASVGIGLNSIVQGNNGIYNANDVSFPNAFLDVMIPIHITNHHTFAFGIGYSGNMIQMENPLTWGAKNGSEGLIKYDAPSTVSNYKSSFNLVRISLPLAYRWYITESRHNKIIELSLIPSYTVYSRLQNNYKENNRVYTEIIKGYNTFNKFQLNARLQYFLFGNIGVYVDYGITPLLNTANEKRMNTLSFGIAINTFE